MPILNSHSKNYTSQSHLRICIVGAGVSGICAAIQLKKKLGLDNFTIFETQSEVGGVWSANVYPGCAVDLPMLLYSYSFEPMPDCEAWFAKQEVVLEYFKSTARKYDLYPHIKFNTVVRWQEWDENLKKWRVSLQQNHEQVCQEELFDVVINGLGPLRVPYFPEIFSSFDGPVMHSAKWDSTVSLDNKIVGIVGNGSSAIQIIPAIATQVKWLHVYQGNPSWIVPIPKSCSMWPFFRFLFKIFPFLMWFLRVFLFLLLDIFVYYGTLCWKVSRYFATEFLDLWRGLVTDTPELDGDTTPRLPFGCVRLTFSGTFYRTLGLPSVKVHTSKIEKVVDNWIITQDGGRQRIEVLILATGYNVNDFFPLEIVGRNKKSITEEWRINAPSSYLAIITHLAPNMFFLGGPNGHATHNSYTIMIELQVELMIKILKQMLAKNAMCVSVKKSAEDNFMKQFRKDSKSHYYSRKECKKKKEISSKLTFEILWPHNIISYWFRTRYINFSHFVFDRVDKKLEV